MKLKEYIDNYNFINQDHNKTKSLYVIGPCGKCKTDPKKCRYFYRVFKDENSLTVAGALLSFGCIHWIEKKQL